MQLSLILKICYVFTILCGVVNTQELNVEDLSVSDQKLFKDFQEKYNKKYQTKEEMEFRFQIFLKNLRILKEEPVFETADGKVLLGSSLEGSPMGRRRAVKKQYTKGINEFVDLTDEEFDLFYLLPKQFLYRPQTQMPAYQIIPVYMPQQTQYPTFVQYYQPPQNNYFIQGRFLQQTITDVSKLKRKVDWKADGKITPVKSQKRCNSCYSFSAVAAIEAQWKIKSGEDIALSEQEILDCDTGNYGCKGGQPSAAFDYVIKNQLGTDEDYPYIAQTHDKCYKGQTPPPKPEKKKKKEGRRLQEDVQQKIAINKPLLGFSFVKDPTIQNQQVNQQWQQPQGQFQNYDQYGQQNNGQNVTQQFGYQDWNNNYQQGNVQQNYGQQFQSPYGNNFGYMNNYIPQYNPYNMNNLYNPYNGYPNDFDQSIFNNQNNQNQNNQNQDWNNNQNWNNNQDWNNQNNQNQDWNNNNQNWNNNNQNWNNNNQNNQNWNNQNQNNNQDNQNQNNQNQNNNQNNQNQNQNNQNNQNNNNQNNQNQNNQNNQNQNNQNQNNQNNNNQNNQNQNNQNQNQNNNNQNQNNNNQNQNNNNQNQDNQNQNNNNQNNDNQNNNTDTQLGQFRFKNLVSYQYINQNIIELITAVERGPVVVAHYVSSQFKFYSKGVFNGDGCDGIDTVNHSSLLVGYDLDAEVPYLLLKNSWGKLWGEEGYYKMEIGELLTTNKGKCLVAGTPFNVMPFIN